MKKEKPIKVEKEKKEKVKTVALKRDLSNVKVDRDGVILE